MPLLLAALAACAVALSAFGVTRRMPVDPTRRRVAEMQAPPQRDTTVPARSSRVRFELWRRAGTLLPAATVERMRGLLERGGSHVSPALVIVAWLGLVVGIACGGALLIASAERVSLAVGAVTLWLGGGAVIPLLVLHQRAQRRTRAIDAALPQAIDTIVTTVEAGLGLQAAMLSVARKLTGPLGEEFGRVMREIGLGRPRDEALLAMARRSGSRDIGMVARAIAQAERSGIAIGSVLRTQSQELRQRRRDIAREQAGRVPVKITVLTILFIFPTLFLLVLGPVALHAIDMLASPAMEMR